ncbi:MAG: PQQ-dependent sugar dehydrogenase [Proteobacteria bacterium]|nr:PQQ-dependent sugar dehydrogenase [Pseudomonadota bacterium]
MQLRRKLPWIALVGVAGVLCCRALLPTVNVPLGHALLGWGGEAPDADALRRQFRVPDGFTLGVYAEGIAGARFLRPTPRGDLLVSQPRQRNVWLLEADANGDGRADGARVLLTDLDRPHGLELHDGWLYVGETGAVRRIRFDPTTRELSGELENVVFGLPAGGNHWTRTVRMGPDGWMYVNVGSSCNVCQEEDPRRAALLRFRPDGSEVGIYATGLRNAVGFAWQPDTGALYATDNGRDLLGDDFPPCELNRVVEGGDYGWPVANGDRVPDPDLGAGQEARIAASIPPEHDFRAHNAPLGIDFLRGPLPEGYADAALVALHGSWNRSRKDGYKVVSLHWGAQGRIEERDFMTGFLRGEQVDGRPVDVVQAADGTIYISDDYAGVIYRVGHGEGARAAAADPARATASAAASDPLASLSPAERLESAARGADAYAAHDCASCHEAAKAAPGVVPFELVELQKRYDLASLAAFFEAPTPPMPAFPLSENERNDLAVFLLAR